MALTLWSSKVLKICLILNAAHICQTRKTSLFGQSHRERYDNNYDSNTMESSEASVENAYAFISNRLQLDMTGSLRRSFVYHAAMEDHTKSVVCSPVSAYLPLGKLAMGSSSRRYTEFREALGFRRSKLIKRFKSMMFDLGHLSGVVKLTIASRLYVSRKHSLTSKFDTRVRHVFRSSCERVDFSDAVGTANKINSWIFSETRGLFNDVIKPNQITSDTSLIITNVVYFKGEWKDSFKNVFGGSFYTPNGQRPVRMMSRSGRYKYVKSRKLDAQILEIPYSSNDVSFLVVLPNENNGLHHLLRRLLSNPVSLNLELSSMEKVSVDVIIPKFNVTSKLDLNLLYSKIGLREIFKSNNKVLTKIIKGQTAVVTKSVHSAVIIVDEYGTEGAGVSALQVEVLSGNKHHHVFKADHPFLFFVVAKGEQLFGGIYTGV